MFAQKLMMHFGKWLMANLFALPLLAQSGLYLSSDSGEKFRVGINNYAQEITYRQRILISELDTGHHHLYLHLLDTGIILQRSIRLPANANYHYLITLNFKGEYQIRYRGVISQLPSPIIKQPYKTALRWPITEPPEKSSVTAAATSKSQDFPKKDSSDSLSKTSKNLKNTKNLPTDSNRLASHNNPPAQDTLPKPQKTYENRTVAKITPVTEMQKARKADSVVTPNRKGKPAVEPGQVEVLPRESDTTVTIKAAGSDSLKKRLRQEETLVKMDSALPTPDADLTLSRVLGNLQKLQYEYEKQKYLEQNFHAALAKPQALLEIFKLLKYDQTRLDIITTFKDEIKKHENWHSILNGFQYEISKNKAQNILQ